MSTSDPQQGQSSEKTTITRKVILVGVGPGDPNYVTVKVSKEIAAADVVAGFATVLAVIEPLITGQRMVLTYRNQEEQLAELARMHADGQRCVVTLKPISIHIPIARPDIDATLHNSW